MPRQKTVYVSVKTHHALKALAARRNQPMGEVVVELVEQAFADIANPWLGPEGLSLPQKMLARVWDDAALDVYNDDRGRRDARLLPSPVLLFTVAKSFCHSSTSYCAAIFRCRM